MSTSIATQLRLSFELLAPRVPELVDGFYTRLFAAAPAVRGLFPSDLSAQKRHLLAALTLVVRDADQLERLAPALREMGARHVRYGARPEHYPVVRDTLLETLAAFAGPAWSEEPAAAWRAALDHVAGLMLEGALQAEAAA
jgi:methyl-accepting chemotaxis protein